MRSFSATDAAFAGFRIIRERPGLVLAWTIISFLIFLGLFLLLAIFLGGAIMSLAQLGAGQEPSTEQVLALMMGVLPAMLLILPLMLIYSSVMVAGVNRVVLRPEERGFYFLRLGADEMRLAVVIFVQGLASFGVNMIGNMFELAARAGSLVNSEGASLGATLLAVVFQLATAAVMVFLTIRFSLARSQSFERRQINIFGTWSLTRGRFWPMFGAYLLAGVLVAMMYILVVVLLVAAALPMIGNLTAIDDISQISNLPGLIGLGVAAAIVFGLVGTIGNIVSFAAPADIYRQISIGESQSEVFA